MPGMYPAFKEQGGELTEDLVIVAGRSLDALWEFVSSAGVAEPLTGVVNVVLQVRDPDAALVAEFSVAGGELTLDAAAGKITWTTAPSVTADCAPGEYDYDGVFVWSDGGITQEFGPAKFTILKGPTEIT